MRWGYIPQWDWITYINIIAMAQYIKKEMPDVHKTGNNLVYYRLKRWETLDFKEFAQRVCKANRLYTPSIIQGVVMALSSGSRSSKIYFLEPEA